jgi:hypothetical protein
MWHRKVAAHRAVFLGKRKFVLAEREDHGVFSMDEGIPGANEEGNN